ncbi:unnamed protein product [Spodoptera littoralis]|uniref:Ig-like domain-containing protein n=1 Tax=Spodoptera littoralis TaxID=7109 RepID=A0A9P0N751_SPOLI|nr:unnamed protein product [Spodoptera littoralis]CAH1642260.1 unnamed protein product [Spodoptera littoralis]
MSTRWKCDIYQRYHGPVQVMYNSEQHTVVKFHFRLYVKGARSVNVSINGEFLNFTKMGLNVKHDGEAFYNFTDQQNIELVCAGVDKQSAVSLEYFNQNGEKIFEIQQERDTSVLLRTRLTSKQEKFHIDCIANTTSPRREYRYRIYFYKKELEHNTDNQDDVFIVTVNGLLERYVRKNGSNFYYPPFKYIEGEIITVSCETKLKYPLQFYFGTYGDSTGIKVKSVNDKIVAVINSSAVLLNRKTLLCGFYTNKNVTNVFARMTFRSDIADRTVRIFGLHRPNILYEYLSGNIWTTVYQYSVDETLSLGCVLNTLPKEDYKFKWTVNGIASKKLGYRDKLLNGMKYIEENITLKLTENNDKKVIKCIAYKNGKMFNFTQVKLQLKDTSNNEYLEADINTYKTILLILLYLAVGVAFITIMIYSFIFWRKRAKMARLLKNPYDNISNQNESPIPPFPPQWDENDHYTKIDDGVMQENYSYGKNDNKMPKYPNLRQSNGPSENHYTEIDDYFKTPYKSAGKNVYQDINVNKNINLNDNKDTYDKLRRDDKLNKQNTDKTAIYEAVHEKHNKADQQNLGDYKNINAMTTINDSAYAYAYDTRPVDAKCRNKDRSALDYDVPYSISDVSRENECYVGPDTPKT